MTATPTFLNALKALAGRHVRGIRDSVPQGYLLGRSSSGSGPVELISMDSVLQGAKSAIVPLPVTGANPTATASDVAVNGTAATFMRSDAAPAVQKATAAQFGLVKPDGAIITVSGGAISAATATTTQLGVVKPDGTTITAAAGIISAASSGSGNIGPLIMAEQWPMSEAPAVAAAGGGGGSPGTPPAIVQSAGSTAASASITLAAAPVSGNLLVALCESSGSAIGTGWTSQASNAGGTNFSFIVTKVAGIGESATQTPIGGTPTVATIAMWELSGQAASPVLFASATTAIASLFASTSNAPGITNALALAAISTDGSATGTFSAPKNITQDFLINTGTRFMTGGHSTAALPVAQMLTTMSASQATRGNIILITA